MGAHVYFITQELPWRGGGRSKREMRGLRRLGGQEAAWPQRGAERSPSHSGPYSWSERGTLGELVKTGGKGSPCHVWLSLARDADRRNNCLVTSRPEVKGRQKPSGPTWAGFF